MSDSPSFRTYECSDPTCRFRFPVIQSENMPGTCPQCGSPLNDLSLPYARHFVDKGETPPREIILHVLLDNIRSLYNVGSIFRSAEATGIDRLHLCGMTATPENPRLAKTALGAEKMVAWQYHKNGVIAAEMLREQDFSLWAIEGGEHATPLFDAAPPRPGQKIALVIGNELAGIDPGILALAERTLYIPMQGRKESLNLTVAFGIAAYHLRY